MNLQLNKMKLVSLIMASTLAVSNLAADESDILASISSDMVHYEEVATKTKNNERYQPYIISVFEGKDLEKLGVKDLEEALALAPGVDITTDNFNNRTMIFRGSNPQAYGQTKLFIDGTLVNDVFTDAYNQYLKMPVEMIKRIEVTRGPGSKTDGVNAYAGSIHVVTYAEQFEGFESKDKVVLKSGSYDYKMGGFVKNYTSGELKVYTDFYYQEDNKNLYAGPDGISQGSLSIISMGHDNRYLARDGDAPVWIKNWNLGLNIDYKDFYVKARNNDFTHGSAYGINWYLPNEDDRQKMPSQYLEVGHDNEFNNFQISIKAGIKKDSWDSDAQLGPKGMTLINLRKLDVDPTSFSWATDGNISFPDGVFGAHSAMQQTLYGSFFVNYDGWDKHKVTIGYRYFKEETYDMSSKLSSWDTGSAALVDYTDTYAFFEKDAKRETDIISLQDEYYASEDLSLIYGISYEDTTYTEAVIDPRVSLVYQADAENIYKLIYSQSHRNPSWQEMYTKNNRTRTGSIDLEQERVTAYEAAYIRKFSADSYLQTNIFKLENKNQIYSSAPPAFANELDTSIQGLELEYKGNFTLVDQFYFNYSYVDGEDNNGTNRTKLANVAQHMAKAYYIYNLSDAISLSGTVRYVGEKKRLAKEQLATDKRENVNAYTKTDVALRYQNRKYDYHVTLAVKNLGDADIRYPSPPPTNTYIEDYRQEATNFLLAIGKEY